METENENENGMNRTEQYLSNMDADLRMFYTAGTPLDGALVMSLAAIANELQGIRQELKRANDDRDAELAYQERMAERRRMLDDC